jgi:general secretion pathway protein E
MNVEVDRHHKSLSHNGMAIDFLRYLLAATIIDERSFNVISADASADARYGLRRMWTASGVSGHDLAAAAAEFFGFERVALAELTLAPSLADRFAPRFLRDVSIFPFRAADGRPALAMGDPLDRDALKAAELALGEAVAIVVASFEDIAAALGGQGDAAPAAGGADSSREDNLDNLRDLASGAPVVRAVDELIDKAMELRASDIHLEPSRDGLVVRMRVDGLLRAFGAPVDAPPQALISRIKIVSGLNIAERRLPQDGAARLRTTRGDLDIRVATMPTPRGESAVIRLLPRDRGLLDVKRLGMAPRDETIVRRLLEEPHGLVVITGPTGSGKTTTLATLLTLLNQPFRKILTIEDPIEYELPGVAQSQVRPEVGLTFAAALRAFLRHDPDVIMVGEVRDAETAAIAVHAALTGHLVLTTLHTDTAAAAAPRLIDLGVEPFLLKSTLRAVIGQRLVRVLCERCRAPHALTHDDTERDPRCEAMGLREGETLYEPRGCERCSGVGYRGRVGVFEALTIDREARKLIGPDSEAGALEAAARRAGMTTMMDDAVAKCRAGLTSIAEALRVTTVR